MLNTSQVQEMFFPIMFIARGQPVANDWVYMPSPIILIWNDCEGDIRSRVPSRLAEASATIIYVFLSLLSQTCHSHFHIVISPENTPL